jgi:hypothetical protein
MALSETSCHLVVMPETSCLSIRGAVRAVEALGWRLAMGIAERVSEGRTGRIRGVSGHAGRQRPGARRSLSPQSLPAGLALAQGAVAVGAHRHTAVGAVGQQFGGHGLVVALPHVAQQPVGVEGGASQGADTPGDAVGAVRLGQGNELFGLVGALVERQWWAGVVALVLGAQGRTTAGHGTALSAAAVLGA